MTDSRESFRHPRRFRAERSDVEVGRPFRRERRLGGLPRVAGRPGRRTVFVMFRCHPRKVEEVDLSRGEVVFRSDHHDLATTHHAFEDRARVSKMVRRGSHVGSDGAMHQIGFVFIRGGFEHRAGRRRDAVDDVSEVVAESSCAFAEGIERRFDRAAIGVAEHDGQACSERGGRELDATDERRSDDIARDAHDEQVADALIEDEFGGKSRVGAGENGGEWALSRGMLGSAKLTHHRFEAARTTHEPSVAGSQSFEGPRGRHIFVRWIHGFLLRLSRPPSSGQNVQWVRRSLCGRSYDVGSSVAVCNTEGPLHGTG